MWGNRCGDDFVEVVKDQQRNFVLIPRRGTTVLTSKVEGIPDDTALSEGQSHFYDIISAIDFVNKNKKPAYMGATTWWKHMTEQSYDKIPPLSYGEDGLSRNFQKVDPNAPLRDHHLFGSSQRAF